MHYSLYQSTWFNHCTCLNETANQQRPLLIDMITFNPGIDTSCGVKRGMNWLIQSKIKRLHCWRLGIDRYFRHTLYNGCNYLCVVGLKWNHGSKRVPIWTVNDTTDWEYLRHHHNVNGHKNLVWLFNGQQQHLYRYSDWWKDLDLNYNYIILHSDTFLTHTNLTLVFPWGYKKRWGLWGGGSW